MIMDCRWFCDREVGTKKIEYKPQLWMVIYSALDSSEGACVLALEFNFSFAHATLYEFVHGCVVFTVREIHVSKNTNPICF